MKKILKISALFLMVAATFSCEEDEIPTANMITPQNGPVLITPDSGTSIVLNPDLMSNPALTLAWEDAAYSVQTPITYNIEVAAAETDFAAPILAGTTTTKTLTWTVEQLNSLVTNPTGLALAPFTAADFDVRIVSSVGSGSQPIYSNPITITVTPYTTANPELAVPGNHQGWSPGTAPRLAASAYGETDYEGYVWLDGDYKFSAPNAQGEFAWPDQGGGPDYGDNGDFANVLAESGEVNATVSTAGYYLVKADTEALTYSATPTNWGIAGNATTNGWDGMIPMTYDPVAKTWSVIATLSTQAAPDNGLKFKANGSWDINFGDSGADGSLEYGGTNIGTAAGTYLIVLDLSNPRQYTYTMTLQ